jgi:hypothetical protein
LLLIINYYYHLYIVYIYKYHLGIQIHYVNVDYISNWHLLSQGFKHRDCVSAYLGTCLTAKTNLSWDGWCNHCCEWFFTDNDKMSLGETADCWDSLGSNQHNFWRVAKRFHCVTILRHSNYHRQVCLLIYIAWKQQLGPCLVTGWNPFYFYHVWMSWFYMLYLQNDTWAQRAITPHWAWAAVPHILESCGEGLWSTP